MKTKIFTLIIAILCLSMIFVACDEQPCTEHKDENNDLVCDVCSEDLEPATEESTTQTTEATTEPPVEPCEVHTDANADKVCDVCKYALVYISELVSPEQETHADMEVSPIPESAELSDFINVEFEDGFLTTAQKLEGRVVDARYIYAFRMTVQKVAIYNEEGRVIRYIIRDYDTLETIISVDTSEFYQIDVQLNDYYIEVRRISEFEASFANYTYSGQSIGEEYKWVFSEDGETLDSYYYDNVCLYYIYDDSRIVYLEDSKDVVYAIDGETRNILHKDNYDSFIMRPEFDIVVGNYGYVYDLMLDTVYVYDLDKWISCVMSYEFPSYNENDDWFVLNNGNILVQAYVELAADSVNFDVLAGGDKYDIVYTLIDVKNKQIRNVEFGYYIQRAYSLKGSDTFTGKAENMFVVYPINNDRLNTNDEKHLIVDNDLTINCDVTDFVEKNGSLIADGLFLGKHSYQNSSIYLDKIFGLDGKEITLPASAILKDNYIIYRNAIYSLEMQLLLDPFKDNAYTYVDYRDSYVMLTKEIVDEDFNITYEYYYYDPSVKDATPVKFADNATIVGNNDSLIVLEIEYYVMEEGTERLEYRYEVRNAKNQFLFTDNSPVWYFNNCESYVEIYLDNGDIYIAK